MILRKTPSSPTLHRSIDEPLDYGPASRLMEPRISLSAKPLALDLRFTHRALWFHSSGLSLFLRTEAFMVTSLPDFAGHANPATLAEARAAGFRPAIRVHRSL